MLFVSRVFFFFLSGSLGQLAVHVNGSHVLQTLLGCLPPVLSAERRLKELRRARRTESEDEERESTENGKRRARRARSCLTADKQEPNETSRPLLQSSSVPCLRIPVFLSVCTPYTTPLRPQSPAFFSLSPALGSGLWFLPQVSFLFLFLLIFFWSAR